MKNKLAILILQQSIVEKSELKDKVIDSVEVGNDLYSQLIEDIESLQLSIEKLRDVKENEASDEETFARSEIEQLQSKIHEITGDGEVMKLFNELLGINAG